MKTMTIEKLQADLEAAGCGQGQELRKHDASSHGHQGDVYVHPIKAKPECWDVETTDQSRQIAIGQGAGSHHTAEGNVRVFWPRSIDEALKNLPVIPGGFFKNEPEAQRQCCGPIIVAKETWRNPHPSHAHHEYPAGVYWVTFQLDRRTMRRVQD
jgi:hypothetical protein